MKLLSAFAIALALVATPARANDLSPRGLFIVTRAVALCAVDIGGMTTAKAAEWQWSKLIESGLTFDQIVTLNADSGSESSILTQAMDLIQTVGGCNKLFDR